MRKVYNILIIVMIIIMSGIFWESNAANFEYQQSTLDLIPEQ